MQNTKITFIKEEEENSLDNFYEDLKFRKWKLLLIKRTDNLDITHTVN